MHKKIIRSTILSMSICIFSLISQASADTFKPNSYPGQIPPLPDNLSSIRLFYSDQGTSDVFRNNLFQLEAQVGFGEKDSHPVFGLDFKHLSTYTPAIFSQRVTAGQWGQTNEAGLSCGYSFGFANIELTPYLKLHDSFVSGEGLQTENLFSGQLGIQAGLTIYPQTSVLRVKYGYSVPFSHAAPKADDVKLYSIGLNTVAVDLSYRILPQIDLYTGWEFWQLPADLGAGQITNNDTVSISGFKLGAGYLF